MLAVSGTVVNASVNMTRRVAATRESESDRAHVRFTDLSMCADLTDLRIGLTLVNTRVLGYLGPNPDPVIPAICPVSVIVWSIGNRCCPQ